MTLGALNHELVSYLRIAEIEAHGQNLDRECLSSAFTIVTRAVVMPPNQMLREYRQWHKERLLIRLRGRRKTCASLRHIRKLERLYRRSRRR
jgi:hypothetical protein